MKGPLDGLRVVDCSRTAAGLRATGLLADYGADVIWVEPPGGDPHREDSSISYSVFNRSKRSIILDVSCADQRDTLIQLLKTVDLFVETWEPDESDQLGLDFDKLHRELPGLVHCSISGFGNEGSLKGRAACEQIVHALVGTMAEQVGYREGPIYEGIPFASIGTAYLAVIGSLAAILRRAKDGVGRHVETSLFDGALAYLSMLWGDTDLGAAPLASGSYRLLSGTYICRDEQYLGVHTGAVGAFGRMMDVLGLSDRIPPSETGRDIGVPLSPEQKKIIQEEVPGIFASEVRAVWLERLISADICAIPHLHPGEVFDEPQTRYNQMVVAIDDPVLGLVEQVAPAARFSESPTRILGPAPVAGADTDAVLAEIEQMRSATYPSPQRVPDNRPLLDGLRVLDMGGYYAGPYTSRLLADLGADVVKLEPPLGDPVRGLQRVFRSASAGKRSIAMNLKDDDAAVLARRLLSWADVVHHNMRPGAAERLGVGFEQVHALNPEIVYLYAPGWGSDGPDKNRQSFAPLMSGYVGAGFEVAGQYNAPLFPVGNEDPGNGLLGAAAILMALIQRQQSGRGQLVENPQLNATMAHVAHIVRKRDGTVLGAGQLDPVQLGVSALDWLYHTRDGWICLAVTAQSQFISLSRVLGRDFLIDPRFADAPSRRENDYELSTILLTAFSERSNMELHDALDAAGVPVAIPVGHNSTAFLRDPDNRRTKRVAELPHVEQGHVREIAVLMRISDAVVAPHRLAPDLGEHTDEILTALGCDETLVAHLRARGVVVGG